MNRFVVPSRKYPGKNISLPVILVSSSPTHRMKIYQNKFLFETSIGLLGLRQLELLKIKLPLSDFVLCLGYESKKVLKLQLPIKTIENMAWEETGDIEAIRLALNIFPNEDRVLILLGDTLPNDGSFNFIRLGESSISYYNGEDEEVGINTIDDILIGTSLEFTKKFSGIAYMEGKELKNLREFCNNTKNYRAMFWEFLKASDKLKNKIKCYNDNVTIINTAKKLEELKYK